MSLGYSFFVGRSLDYPNLAELDEEHEDVSELPEIQRRSYLLCLGHVSHRALDYYALVATKGKPPSSGAKSNEYVRVQANSSPSHIRSAI